jgi:hypothetical protein
VHIVAGVEVVLELIEWAVDLAVVLAAEAE